MSSTWRARERLQEPDHPCRPVPRPRRGRTRSATRREWSGSTATRSSLLNELRVAGTGVQVMLAFLLVVPFNSGFRGVTSFERYDYFVTLLCIAVAAALLIAPSIHHRLLFRLGQKSYLVRIANRSAIVGMAFLAAGFTGILVLISDVMFGGLTAAVVGVLSAGAILGLWFVLPLRHVRRLSRSHESPAGEAEPRHARSA